MKRVLLLVPDTLSFDQLTEAQQEAITRIFGQYVLPVPGSKSWLGKVICDAVCADSFDPANMPALGLTWEIIGMWQWDGHTPDLTTLVPLNEAEYLIRMPDRVTVDENGNETSRTPPVLYEMNRWAGWPVAF